MISDSVNLAEAQKRKSQQKKKLTIGDLYPIIRTERRLMNSADNQPFLRNYHCNVFTI